MIVEKRNGQKSNKVGTNKNHPQHSVFEINNKIKVIRIREWNGAAISGIEIIDSDNVKVFVLNNYDEGNWKEY